MVFLLVSSSDRFASAPASHCRMASLPIECPHGSAESADHTEGPFRGFLLETCRRAALSSVGALVTFRRLLPFRTFRPCCPMAIKVAPTTVRSNRQSEQGAVPVAFAATGFRSISVHEKRAASKPPPVLACDMSENSNCLYHHGGEKDS